VVFHGFDGIVGECVGEDAAFAGVAGFVDTAVCVEGVFGRGEDRVELGLFDVGFVAVDGLQSSIGVD
jgi:hypothetical protein